MNRRSILLLIISAALAIGLAFTVRGMLTGAQQQSQAGLRVLVAARTLPQGSFVKADQDLVWKSWPTDSQAEGYLIEGQFQPESLAGAVARRQVLKDEPVTEAAFVKASEGGFMAAVLEPGMRAISIAVDETTGNAGFIFPGDRVDLILTHRVQSTDSQQEGAVQETLASETFVENVRILATDQSVENPNNTATVAKTVTIEVTRQQAEKVNVAKDLGRISLSLRSLARREGSQDGQAEEGTGQFTRDSDVSPILNPKSSSSVKVQVVHGKEREQIEFDR